MTYGLYLLIILLQEARAVFRQRLTDAAKTLKQLAKSIGNNIDKARPYFEALNQSKKVSWFKIRLYGNFIDVTVLKSNFFLNQKKTIF